MATQKFNTDVDVNGEVKGTSLDINGAADINGGLTLSSSSSFKLSGGMNTAGNFDAAKIQLNSTNTVNNTGFHGMRFATSSSANYGWSFGANRSIDGRGSLRFYEHSGSNSGTERFTLLQDGNIGIGVAAPTKALQVSGEALFGNGTDGLLLSYSNGNSSGIIDTGHSSTALEFRVGNTQELLINGTSATFAGTIGSGAITSTGKITGTELEGTSLDINGNADISGNTQLGGTLTVGVDDTGHDVKFYAATSGGYMLWDESANRLLLPDATTLGIGTDSDLLINHSGTATTIDNSVGNLLIRQYANDSDIIFQSDDGSGGVTAYLTLDGSAGTIEVAKTMNMQGDLDVSGTITGDGSGVDSINASNISSGTLASARVGTLNQNTTGSSGSCTGNAATATTLATARTIAGVSFNGSANISLNNNAITNGAGYTGDQSKTDINALAITTVGTINDGEWRGTRINTAYQYQRQTFDFKGYSTHDGTNYEMAQSMTDTNAPFEHNTSTGANGTDATSVSLLIRAAGQVMPYAGTVKKWTGWASGSGSGTTYIALFRYRPVAGNSSAVSCTLIDEQTMTVAGAQKAIAIEQTSFTDGDIAAGDIIISMMKGVSGKTTYFTSTMEIEWD